MMCLVGMRGVFKREGVRLVFCGVWKGCVLYFKCYGKFFDLFKLGRGLKYI